MLFHLSSKYKINFHSASRKSNVLWVTVDRAAFNVPYCLNPLTYWSCFLLWELWHLDLPTYIWMASNNLAVTPVTFTFTSRKSRTMPGFHHCSDCSTWKVPINKTPLTSHCLPLNLLSFQFLPSPLPACVLLASETDNSPWYFILSK